MKLTAKQKRFCEEYIVDCNATQAAIRAGYKEKYAHTNANKLLQKTTLKNYINEMLENVKSNNIADATEVMEYLTSVVRGKSMSEIVVIEGVGEGCSIARTMQKQPDEKERLKAAELLGKRYSLFKDNVNVDGVSQVVIINDLED
ncbi:MAG: terminase small subunit [Eubacterium sp.]|nr:terminase small subunit [Eubacterium sp.]